jgi:hypothetical protein
VAVRLVSNALHPVLTRRLQHRAVPRISHSVAVVLALHPKRAQRIAEFDETPDFIVPPSTIRRSSSRPILPRTTVRRALRSPACGTYARSEWTEGRRRPARIACTAERGFKVRRKEMK